MKALRQLRTNLGILFRARRNRFDFLKAMLRRPQLLTGTGAYEIAIATSARVDARLKVLAECEVAAIVACEYCLDIGSALARHEGIREDQLRALANHRTSDAFDPEEHLVLELAEALTRNPAIVDDGLRHRLDATFTPAQLTELAAVIAWENQRARLNQGLGVRPSGFSDGAYCLLPHAADVTEVEARSVPATVPGGPGGADDTDR